MNGEIVEGGTHDELIHAKGKYLALWSKQVYVRPTDDQARSQSPEKRDAEIINDLTPSRQKAELAKVMATTADKESSTHEDEFNEQSSQEPAKEPASTDAQMSPKSKPATISAHKREVRDGSQ